jgi:hypothetical protein
MSFSALSAFIFAASSALTGFALHIRGLAEKIWKVFAPHSTARSTAFQLPPAVDRCTPIRFRAVVAFAVPAFAFIVFAIPVMLSDARSTRAGA